MDATIEPFHAATLDETQTQRKEWFRTGMEAIRRGEVAAVLMAGGQGTRLGSSDPKGMYNIQLPSGSSLFQLQAERIVRLSRLAGGAAIPFYVMTSEFTHRPTVEFFAKHKYFGLPEKDVKFFQQGSLPCVDMEGRILLEKPTKACLFLLSDGCRSFQ